VARSGLPKLNGPRSWRRDLEDAMEGPEPLPEDEQRRNAYVCDTCGGVVVTVDRHKGVTPMFLACRAKGYVSDPANDCTGTGQSCMYRLEMLHMALARRGSVGAMPTEWPEPTWEWYTPSPAELRRLESRTAEHGGKGGLLLRRIEA
jgi:hypothetical protein